MDIDFDTDTADTEPVEFLYQSTFHSNKTRAAVLPSVETSFGDDVEMDKQMDLEQDNDMAIEEVIQPIVRDTSDIETELKQLRQQLGKKALNTKQNVKIKIF